MTKFRISVIVPTYNRANRIGNAIESILRQSVSVDEIVVVDDGSIDDTEARIATYGDSVRYIRQQNAGASAARNTGIRAASGDWIAFLDSDDSWHPQKIQKQLRALHESGASACCTGFDDDAGTAYINLVPEVPLGTSRFFQDGVDLVFRGNNHPLIQSLLVRKSLITKLGMFDETLTVAEDTKLMYRIAFATGIVYINEPLFELNRKRETPGLMDEKNIDAVAVRYQCFCRVQSEAYWLLIAREAPCVRRVGAHIGYYASVLSELYSLKGRPALARRYAREALRFTRRPSTVAKCILLLLAPRLMAGRLKRRADLS